MDTIAIFGAIDDFCSWCEPRWEQHLLAVVPKRRRRRAALCLSEIMTIIVEFHRSGYRTCHLQTKLYACAGYFFKRAAPTEDPTNVGLTAMDRLRCRGTPGTRQGPETTREPGNISHSSCEKSHSTLGAVCFIQARRPADKRLPGTG